MTTRNSEHLLQDPPPPERLATNESNVSADGSLDTTQASICRDLPRATAEQELSKGILRRARKYAKRARRRPVKEASFWIQLVALPIVLWQSIVWSTTREESAKREMWSVINGANGIRADGGRSSALARLNELGVNLRNLDLRAAVLDSLPLGGGEMSAVRLDSARLYNATFENADLSNGVLAGASIVNGRLRLAELRDANITGMSAPRADLSCAHLHRAIGVRANFAGANLDSAKLEFAILDSAAFQHADLHGTEFSSASLRGANFEGARMQRSNLSRASLAGAKFLRANLAGANLSFSVIDDENAIRRAESLVGANIHGLSGVSDRFRRWALDTAGAVEFSELAAATGKRVEIPATVVGSRAGPKSQSRTACAASQKHISNGSSRISPEKSSGIQRILER